LNGEQIHFEILEKHRALQEKFDTRRTADLLKKAVVHAEFENYEAGFIQSREVFLRCLTRATRRAFEMPNRLGLNRRPQTSSGEITLDAYAELLAKGEA
jgi:hypothetical protein